MKQLKQIFSSSTNRRIVFLSIILSGLIIRLLLIFSIEEPIDRDAEEYFNIANNLLDGKGFTIDGIHPTVRRSAGYPFILAVVISIAGRNPDALYIFQSCVNIFTIILIYFSLKYFNVIFPIRIIIMSLFTLSTSFVFVNTLYAEIITMFFVALLLYISVIPQLKEKPILKSILIGLIIGILIHLRPPFLYFPIFLILAIPFARYILKKQVALEFAVISITTIFVIFPWTIRNKVVFDRWIPLVSAGGNELWQANVEIPNRVVWYSVTDIAKYEQQRRISAKIQRKLISEYKSKYELHNNREALNSFLSEKAKSIILHHPFRYALLSFNRFLIFWFSPPIGSTTLKSITPILFWVVLIFKYLITIAALGGFIFLCKEQWNILSVVLLLILYSILLHSFTHSIQRYFLPLIPISYFCLGWLIETKMLSRLGIKDKIIRNI